jgi:diguanylate cyclase (GGDEF)-like protein/PAS domain S-box-containing protein
MVRVLTWLSNEHDWRLVAVALTVCVLASLAAITLFQHARATRRGRWMWLLTAGLASGLGIWAAHLIAVLAYEPAITTSFHLGMTAASLAVAVGVTALGLAVAAAAAAPWNMPVGGAILGAGIVIMHDVAIAGLAVHGRVVWAMDLIAASVIVAISFAMAALVVATRRDDWRGVTFASLLLASGVVAHHAIAMSALAVLAEPALAATSSPAVEVVAAGVAGVTVAVLGMALVALMADRRLRRLYRKQNQKLDAALNNMSQGLCMFDASTRLVVCNQRYMQMYNLSPDIVKPGCLLHDLLVHRTARGSFSGDPAQYVQSLLASIAQGEHLTTTVEVGDGRVIAVVNSPMAGGGWVATHEDITGRRRAELALDETRRFLNSVFEHVPATVVVKDAKTRKYVLINRAAEKFYGMSSDRVIGHTVYDFFPKEAADAITGRDEQLLGSGESLHYSEHAIQAPSGDMRLVTTQRVIIRGPDGKPQYLLGVTEDVTERKRAEARIEHLAHHDTLTDLPNRAAFNQCLAHTLDEAKKTREAFALMSLDLDRLSEINDVFGHATGDALIREVSQRFAAAAEGAFLARLGGDEFALIVPGEQPAAAAQLADRLLATVAEPIAIDERRLQVGITIGIAVYPNDGADAASLISNADAALYRAKAGGRGAYRFFEADMDRRLRERRALVHDLRLAIERGELAVHYQPQARINGEITGFEALVRWVHPTRGMIAPSEFIPVAEESGLVLPLGEWILRDVAREAASWPRKLNVAVNLSPVQFKHGDLPGLVHTVLLESGLAPDRLELEITEGVLIDDLARALSILRRLKLLGVRIAMDDFGTGYSSLSNLQAFPFDKIKIDRSFISNLEASPQAATIVRAVIGLGKGLDLPVVAEGVETKEQLAFLSNEDCTEVQGYLIGRPQPIESYAVQVGRPKPDAARLRKAISA